MANLVRVCIILVASWLALIFGLSSLWLGSAVSLILGGAWLLGRELRRDVSAMAALVNFTVLAVIGLFVNLPAWAMLIEVIGVLVTWDLHLFEARLSRAMRIDNRPTLIRAHLERLAIVVTLSLLLGGLGLGIDLQLNLLLAIAMGGLVVYVVARILRRSQ